MGIPIVVDADGISALGHDLQDSLLVKHGRDNFPQGEARSLRQWRYPEALLTLLAQTGFSWSGVVGWSLVSMAETRVSTSLATRGTGDCLDSSVD